MQLLLAKNVGYETHGEGREVRKQPFLSHVFGGGFLMWIIWLPINFYSDSRAITEADRKCTRLPLNLEMQQTV